MAESSTPTLARQDRPISKPPPADYCSELLKRINEYHNAGVQQVSVCLHLGIRRQRVPYPSRGLGCLLRIFWQNVHWRFERIESRSYWNAWSGQYWIGSCDIVCVQWQDWVIDSWHVWCHDGDCWVSGCEPNGWELCRVFWELASDARKLSRYISYFWKIPNS